MKKLQAEHKKTLPAYKKPALRKHGTIEQITQQGSGGLLQFILGERSVDDLSVICS